MILVTGATGHLGSHVLFELTSAGKSVRALFLDSRKIELVKKIFNFYHPNYLELLEKIEWVQAGINDYGKLISYMHDIQHVYHIAGKVSFNNGDRKILNQVNIYGTANVVNACLETGIEKLCHVSSISALGELESPEVVDENVIWNQGSSASAYGISKYKGEMEVWRGIYEGLNAVIVNPSVIIGPGMWIGPGSQILSSINKGLKFYPSGSSGYVDVRDVARSMILLTNSNYTGDRYIVNAENMKHQHFMNLIADAFERPRPVYRVNPFHEKLAVTAEFVRKLFTGLPPRINLKTLKIASENLAYSNAKIRDALGMIFIPVEESVKYTVQLFKEEMNCNS
jgi:dihydroflavonol-4-reductase